MSKYQEFLDYIGILSEEEFNKIVESLPEFNLQELDFVAESYSSDDVVEAIMDYLMKSYDYAFIEYADFDNKSFILNGVKTLDELESIKNLFKGWKIENYEEVLDDIKENEEYRNKENLLNKLSSICTTEKLEEIVSNYDKK